MYSVINIKNNLKDFSPFLSDSEITKESFLSGLTRKGLRKDSFFILGGFIRMAQRRMFSKTITNSSRFLMMPQSAQNLYFHLGMNADDDGYCEHFTVMRMTESKPDDLKILHAKEFVKVFDDKVLVILDWHENNYIRSDRYNESKYLEIYKDEIKKISYGIPDDNQKDDKRDTQVRLGKDNIGKERLKIIYHCEFFNIDEKQHNNYKDLHPKLDVIYKYKEANQWLIDHPKKRYTNYGRFITNWLRNSYKYDNDNKNSDPEKLPDCCFPKKSKAEVNNSLE